MNNREIGEKIYNEALANRSGFDIDLDEIIWNEIFEDIGNTVLNLVIEKDICKR